MDIQQITPDDLSLYAQIPIAFEVRSALAVEPIDQGLGGICLTEESVLEPYVKDYDAQEEGGPERWPHRFDVSKWGFFVTLEGERPVGGATVAFDTPEVHVLAGRGDLAALWDIRVKPGCRRRGVGATLFSHAAQWARNRGCVQLKIETQNINVPACRFYAAQGCTLEGLDIHAYGDDPTCAHETMLLWYHDLRAQE